MTPESAAPESHLDSEPATSARSRSLLIVGVSLFAGAVFVFLAPLLMEMIYEASLPAYSSPPTYGLLGALLLSIAASLLYWPLLFASFIVSAYANERAPRKRLPIATMIISFVFLLPATLCLGVTFLWLLPMFIRSA